jgi:hypothetical protein
MGPTHVRRLVLLALAAGLLVSGCGTERPVSVRRPDASFSPEPAQPTAKPEPAKPSEKATPGLQGPLATFPLGLGYAAENGDDHSPVVVTTEPATHGFGECGRKVWDPRADSTDVIGIEFRGEAEWFRGRTLVLFPSTEAASSAVDVARDVITSCPRDDGDDYGWTEHTLINYFAGDQSVGWIDRWWTTELDGFDTGLTVYHVVRVDRAVLFSYEYDEGNGSDESRDQSIADATVADRPMVARMRQLGG